MCFHDVPMRPILVSPVISSPNPKVCGACIAKLHQAQGSEQPKT